MATLTDKAVGSLLILLALSIFSYYTTWVLVLPFLDSDHFLRSFFLPQVYAITLPLIAGVVLLAIIGMFIAVVTIQDSAKKRARAKLKKSD